jgi:hypothetical protein
MRKPRPSFRPRVETLEEICAPSVTVLENTPYIFSPANFGVSNPSDPSAPASMSIANLPMFGALTDASAGIFNTISSSLTIDSGTQIYANFAIGGSEGMWDISGFGGGIASGGTLIMSSVYLGYNSALNEGGGLFSNGASRLTSVDIEYNGTTDYRNGKGGGIYVHSGNTTLVSGCIVANHTSGVNGTYFRPK